MVMKRRVNRELPERKLHVGVEYDSKVNLQSWVRRCIINIGLFHL